jgi:23S rRNA (adenine2503-C2)-methyltransferase
MRRRNIKRLRLESLKELITTRGQNTYRAEQIFQWIWQKNAADFTEMTNISKSFRSSLSRMFTIQGLHQDTVSSARDGSQKFLFRTSDHKYVESVFIPEGKRKTVCISTQIGCPIQCAFCATGNMKFSRNLKSHEIADQARMVQQHTREKITNVVFMGMGEPLLNLRETLDAIEISSSPIGLSISKRHTTISTVGILEGMRALLNTSSKVKLAISLNFADENLRKEMIPVAKKNPLSEILQIAREYSRTKNMVTFEYVMIKNLNDHQRDARLLMSLLRGIPAKINLIPYNEHPLLPFERPSDTRIADFYNYLLTAPQTVTLRKSRGQEIHAGCGQLAARRAVRRKKK